MSDRKKIVIVFIILVLPIGLYGVFRYFNLDVAFFQPRASESLPQSIASYLDFTGYQLDHRVDSDGNGIFDSYWTLLQPASNNCTLSLFSLDSGALKWARTMTTCPAPPGAYYIMFFNRSFMGDAASDFSMYVAGPATATNPQGLYLYAGDGATGVVRDFAFPVGDTSRVGFSRLNGVAVVNFNIAKYPGPALFIRTNGGYGNQHGHLLYFPANSVGGIDVSTDPAVITNPLVQQYPFPGMDISEIVDPPYMNRYTAIYNQFNAGLRPCTPIPFSGQGAQGCGVPDGFPPTNAVWNTGNGEFMDSAVQGDIDADGVEDILTTYEWLSVAYPGKPKGNSAFLGAPQYEAYLNPQNDGTQCHSGRQYGLTKLTNIDQDPYLETVQIGGLPIDAFSDVGQNISRYLAVVQTEHDAVLPTVNRVLAWDKPLGTGIPGCGSTTKTYDNVLQVPGDGTITTNGYTPYIIENRWTQLTQNEQCVSGDFACLTRLLNSQTGYWTFEVRSTSTGNVAKAFTNNYVWDTIPDPSGNVWVLYSANANIWNLGYTDSTQWNTTHIYRNDLHMGLLDLNTLQISRDQTVGESAKPFLVTGPWQTQNATIGSHWHATRLLTIPSAGSTLPMFFVRNAQGYSAYVFQNNAWQLGGNYNTSGVLTAAADTTLPTGTINQIAAPTQTTGFGTITGTAMDNDKVATIQLAIRRGTITSGICNDWNGAAWTPTCTVLAPSSTSSLGTKSATWSYNTSSVILTPGQTYRVFLNVIDASGNKNNWSTYQEVFYNNLPASTLTPSPTFTPAVTSTLTPTPTPTVTATFVPTITPTATATVVVCSAVYDPVCGVNGVTYSNRCVAERQNNVAVAYNGVCRTPTPIPTPAPTPTLVIAPSPTAVGLKEGDMISAAGSFDPDIYIINSFGFKRLFLNPIIFSFYGHLGGFAKVKTVTPPVRDSFGTSGLFQNCETNDGKVWAVQVVGEDDAVLHHVQVSGAEAVAQDPNFFKKVFCINNNEFYWYPKTLDAYTSLSQIPVYRR